MSGSFWRTKLEVGSNEREVGHLTKMRPDNPYSLLVAAVIYCVLERDDEALDRLERSVNFGLERSVIEMDLDLPRLGKHFRYRRLLELAG